MLHQARLTPTQQAAVSHHTAFRSKINEIAEARKVIPIVEIQQPQVVPVRELSETEMVVRRIEFLTKELDIAYEQLGVIKQRSGPKIKDIQEAVCVHYGISWIDLISSRRTASLVRCRQIAVWLCRKLTVRSLPEIGRHFGNRDHTTCLHSARQIEKKRQNDAVLESELQIFINQFSRL
jgi:chromosomal replication initiation ATPase DnaA